MNREKYTIDATGKSVGRLATNIANLLRGKNKPEFTPHLDQGAVVEVNNITKLKFTGKKFEQKKYYHYSGYPGGMKEEVLENVFEKDPDKVLRKAVRNMLPDNKLRKNMIKRLIINS
jgi:large subunit ribosomal protein L13